MVRDILRLLGGDTQAANEVRSSPLRNRQARSGALVAQPVVRRRPFDSAARSAQPAESARAVRIVLHLHSRYRQPQFTRRSEGPLPHDLTQRGEEREGAKRK